MKKIIVSVILILLLLTAATPCTVALVDSYKVDDYTYNDMPILAMLINEQKARKDAAHEMAEAARRLGYAEEHEIILLAQDEWFAADELELRYQACYDDLAEHWHLKEEEYPEATYIWRYLKGLGYNDYVCAGILGNIMNEVGGDTLKLQPTIYSPDKAYYGICQWNNKYKEIWDASLENQCNYLEDTIAYELDTFGYAYKKEFNYDKFFELTDVESAALAFAKCYERCNSSSFNARKKNAVNAYNYFVS